MDLDAIRRKLNNLQNTQKKTDRIWKPLPGKHQIRIVPYKFNQDNPFIELYFHYNLNGKTYISPQTFGRPDPIVEFSDALKTAGSKEDWKTGKQMEPKLRTYLPIIVRGEESEGVKFWGFGKTVYQEILGYIADPDYGDISHPKNGRDLTVEYISAKEAGTNFPTTNLRVKPSATMMVDDVTLAKSLVNDQINITDLYQEPTYDELKLALEQWLTPSDSSDDSDDSLTTVKSLPTQSVDTTSLGKSTPMSDKMSEVDSAFDDLFNN